MLKMNHRRSPKNLTLNDIYPDWVSGSGVVSSLTTAPWYSEVDHQGLDLAYHGVRSGQKFASSICYEFIDDDGEITVSGSTLIAKMLMAKYGQKWAHLWGLYEAEYNPLHSYSLSESLTETIEGEDNTSVEYNETVAKDGSVTESQSHSNTESSNWNESENVDGEKGSSHSNTIQRMPNLTETLTEDTEVVVDGSVVRTPNLTETLTEDTEVVVDGSVVRTPNLQDRTVLDETVESTGNEEDETVHGHVVGTQTADTKSSTLSVYGFNSSSAIPKEAQSGTDGGSSTVTNSGTDTDSKETSATTDRDSTSTTNRTGSETTTDDTTTETDSTKTTTKTGSETEVDYGTTEDSSSEERESSGSGSGTDYGVAEVNRTIDDDTTKEMSQNTGFETSRERVSTRTKSGNVFKSPGELLSIDRDFWLTEFFDIVFADIDALLALSVFSDSPVRHKVY